MTMTYVCTRKCFFMGGVRAEGERIVLDSKVGDSCPWLRRAPVKGQLEMQSVPEEETMTEAPAVEVGAEAVSEGASEDVPGALPEETGKGPVKAVRKVKETT